MRFAGRFGVGSVLALLVAAIAPRDGWIEAPLPRYAPLSLILQSDFVLPPSPETRP